LQRELHFLVARAAANELIPWLPPECMLLSAAAKRSHKCIWLVAVLQVAVLLAPVAFVTHVDSVPLMTLATLNTDEVSGYIPTALTRCCFLHW